MARLGMARHGMAGRDPARPDPSGPPGLPGLPGHPMVWRASWREACACASYTERIRYSTQSAIGGGPGKKRVRLVMFS